MSRLGPRHCDRCDVELTTGNKKVVPVHHPSPYVIVCMSCWGELEQIESKMRDGVVVTLKTKRASKDQP